MEGTTVNDNNARENRQARPRHKTLAVRLAEAGLREWSLDLLRSSPGMRPHTARLAAGACLDAENDRLAKALYAWADAEDTRLADKIAAGVLLLCSSETGWEVTARTCNLAAEAVLGSTAFAPMMDGGLLPRPEPRQSAGLAASAV